MTRANYGRELAAWCLVPVMLGVVEGGLVGVIAKTAFAGHVPPQALNLAVAILAGSPAFANVVSFLWAAASHGRPKVAFLVALQAAAAACVVVTAFVPGTAAGLLLFTAAVVGARMCWSGVVTVRATVWRANYPRDIRAGMAGRLATVQALAMTVAALGVGLATNVHDEAFRLLYPIAAACAMAGAWIYSGVRPRGHRSLLRAENADPDGPPVNPFRLRRVLLTDDRYRRYMTCMFLFGTGNIMVTAPLVIMLKDRFGLDPFRSVLIVSAIPTILMPLSVPIWSRLLDRVHIVQFRAAHSWAFVFSTAAYLVAAVTGVMPLLWLGAVGKGVAVGGGVLGWNLGHHDFAPAARASQYMGVHVTLTGVRGLVAPVIGVTLYEILQWAAPGAGPWVLALCLALSVTGALGFMVMRSQLVGPGGGSAFDDGPPIQGPATA